MGSKGIIRATVLVFGLLTSGWAAAQSANELIAEAEALLAEPDTPDAAQTAVDLLYEAIDKNSSKALFVLGRNLLEGATIEKDEPRGLAMLHEASALGFSAASFYLHDYYIVNEDHDQAVEILKPLAEAGNFRANVLLADFHVSGPDDKRNLRIAKEYLDQAVATADDPALAAARTARTRISIIRTELDKNPGTSQVTAALEQLEPMAAENVVPALTLLSSIYLQGLYSIDPDPVKGLGFLAKAAELGNRPSAIALAREYISGRNVSRDLDKAIALLEPVYESGARNAGVLLATLVIDGEYDGFSRDRAVSILSDAAEKGNVTAALTLSRALADQTTGDTDISAAIELAQKAADGRGAGPNLFLANLLLERGSGADKTKALAILERFAAEGAPPAITSLIKLNLDGKLFPRNEEIGKQYIAQLSASGNTATKMFLSNLYLDGELIEENNLLGIRYLTEAYEAGVSAAVVPYANLFLEGNLVDQDIQNGIRILTKGSAQGNVIATKRLALLLLEDGQNYTDKARGVELLESLVATTNDPGTPLQVARTYLSGAGVEKNIDKAIEYLKVSSDRGHRQAPLLLGLEYFRGTNTDRNYRLAQQYLETALERGNNRALISLGDIYWRNRQNALAIESYQKAADLGVDAGKVKIGLAYLDPIRSPGRQAEGLAILDDLSAAGVSRASMALARVFQNGQFKMPEDSTRALAYYDAAIAAGNEGAEGSRLVLLSKINGTPEHYEAISSIFGEMSEAGKRRFMAAGFKTANRQIAYIVQKKLQSLGYYTGPLDGLFGQGSQAAMLLFCRDDALNGPCSVPQWSSENAYRVEAFQPGNE